MEKLYKHLLECDKIEVKDLSETIKEFSAYNRKHMFDPDQTTAKLYQESISLMKNRIKEIKSVWKN